MAETNKVFDVFKEGKRRASLKALTESSKMTRVLLVCVYNQGSTLITHDTLHNAFSAYGKINRILIFDKLKVWKAFVEFSDLESAIEAKRNMNDVLLFKDGTRMNVYFSNREMIQFQNNNSGGKDYTVENSFEAHSAGDQSLNPAMFQSFLAAPPLITHSLSAGAKGYISQFQQQNKLNKNYSIHSESNSDIQSQNGEGSLNQSMHFQGYQQEYMAAPPMITHSLSCGAQRSVSTTSRTNSQFNSPHLKTKWWMNRDEAEDDDDDEILEIINEHQQELREGGNHNNKDLRKPSEEDKLEDALEAQFLNNAFTNKEAGLFEKQPKISRTLNALSLSSKPYSDPLGKNQTWQQQSNQMLQMGNGPISHTGGMQNQKMRENGTYSPISLKIPMQNTRSNVKHFTTPQAGYSPYQNQHSTFNPKYQQQQQQQQQTNGKKQAEIMARINYLCSDKRTNQPSLIRAQHQLNNQIEMTLTPPDYSSFENQNSESILDLIESEISQQTRNYSPRFPSNQMQTPEQNESFPPETFNPHEHGLMNGLNANQLGNDTWKDSTKRSQALYIKGLNNDDVHVQMLYNIFSNFGNVVSIVLVKEKRAALLEYENADFATIAKESLNNLVFMGSPLSIFYSSYSVINPRDKLNQNDPGEEVMIGNPKNWRFQKNKPMQFNPPSQVLHISNLAKEACSDVLFQHFFGPFGTIEALKFTSFENRNTCLLKMSSVEESLLVVAYLNDAEIAGRNIYISFTRCKI